MQPKSLQYAFIAALAVAIPVLFSFGCAEQSVASAPCQELDWYELGRADGAKGLIAEASRTVKPICPRTNVALIRTFYQNGYNSSIVNFCTYAKGFVAGEASYTANVSRTTASVSNRPSNVNRCPALLRTDYQRGWTSGLRFATLQKSRQDISIQLQSLNSYLRDRSIALPRRAILHGQKIKLEAKIKVVKRQIASIQQQRALN